LDIEKAFDTRWHPGLPYELSELEFSTILNKLIASFLTNRKFTVLVDGKHSASRETVEALPQGSALAPVLYSPYTNEAPAAAGTHLALFADDTCIYMTENHERPVLCKLQRGLTAVKSWCGRWNIKIKEGKTKAIYFSSRVGIPNAILQRNGRHIFFVNNVNYFGFILHRRMTRRFHIERTAAKPLGTYIRT
jgi:hypothetical protein